MKDWNKLKKTLVITGVGILGLMGLANANTPNGNSTIPTAPSSTVQGISSDSASQQAVEPVNTVPPSSSTQSNLSNNNTYTNVDGNTVHSPAYTSDGSIPAGATAKCYDGTYSFSQHHNGTCSHHGGVAEWL